MGIDWRGQLAALARDGYTRTISLETHWKGPDGDKFQGSVICGRNLKDLVRTYAGDLSNFITSPYQSAISLVPRRFTAVYSGWKRSRDRHFPLMACGIASAPIKSSI